MVNSFLTTATGSAVAVTGRFAAGYHRVDDRRSTPHAGIHRDRSEVAVPGAGAALHAQVPVGDRGAFILHLEHALRADLDTPAAASALVY